MTIRTDAIQSAVDRLVEEQGVLPGTIALNYAVMQLYLSMGGGHGDAREHAHEAFMSLVKARLILENEKSDKKVDDVNLNEVK